MDIEQIRNRYLKFFERHRHVIIPSSSLLPENDPTTLFTGSGMQPILPYLLGAKYPSGKRIVNSQKCFRAEDIVEVGDNRHTTFFEMLGNWSLGDYFKREQLGWFFSFLTDEIGLSPERLYVTVFSGDSTLNLPKDTESAAIWKELFKGKGIEAHEVELGSEERGATSGMQGGRIFYYGAEKNWWSRAGGPQAMPAGEPGGPDSEVFFEFSDVLHDRRFGNECHVNCDCGRFLEIGNSVFMEYVKTDDGTFTRLPQRNVDFGGGLERIAAAYLGTPDMFRIDVFGKVIAALESLSGTSYEKSAAREKRHFRIISDHLRAALFIASDGVVPANKERGYILRRLVRRSLLAARSLGLSGSDWMQPLLSAYAESYRAYYAEIDDNQKAVIGILTDEAEKFLKTLEAGLKQFERLVNLGTVTAEDVFNLYQSYGFPEELSLELLKDRGITINEKTMQAFRERHQAVSRAGSQAKFKGGLQDTGEMSVRYHTATHLLGAALRAVLGQHVNQKGSNITPERLRFDFPHDHKLTADEIKRVEDMVNAKIKEALPVEKITMKLADAYRSGVVGVFGERYGEVVSVYRIGSEKEGFFSKEICGGPHVTNTRELAGRFKIVKEEAVSQGVRRIRAVLEI